MKKTVYGLAMGLLSISMLASCDNGEEKKDAQGTKPAAGAKADVANGNLPNYRFIDSDSIMLRYNLSIDFNEQMIVLQNNLAEEEKRQRASIQSRAAALQKKMETVQSQSEMDALKTEYQSIERLQGQAEQKLSQMGMEMERTLSQNAQTVMDSLSNFLKDYAQQRGYDAVFVKNCAPYYNPALDVTDEVVEGLNARYNKVKK